MLIRRGLKLYILIFIFTMIIQIPMFKVDAYNIEQKGFNVLVLNSYHQGHNWESSILDGLNTYIKENDKNINLKVEYLDFRNNYNKEYIKSLKLMLEEKYPKGSIDAIYTVNDEAYEILNKEVLNKNSNFYKIPLIFSGVDHKIDGDKYEKEYSAGIYHRDDTLGLLGFISDLTPNVKNINLIIENSKYGDSVQSEIDKILNTYMKDRINVEYIRSNYTQDIYKQLSKIGYKEDTVNIIAGEFQDKSSEIYISPKVLIDKLKKYSTAPIYSTDSTYLNTSILGGHMDIGQNHAKIIGKMISQIKDGVKINNIDNVTEPVAQGYITYKSIYEYKIDPLAIDEDINIMNKPAYCIIAPTWVKILIFIVLFFIFMLIIFLIQTLARNKKLKQKKLEEQEKAIERDRLKSDFIVNLSHELRTPINIILGTSKVLENKARKSEIDGAYLLSKIDNINQNSYRILKISNNVIDITKAEAGMFQLVLENCNIVNIIEDVFESSIDFAKRKNIDMIFDTKQEEIKISVDVFQIQRLILNLLSNAIKFTHENGIIKLIMYKKDNKLIIEVKDNGVGIAQDKISYIFQRFYQVDSLYTRKNEGSGIGLCISKEIAQKHGGTIEVESKIEKGSTFRVTIPINLYENLEDYDPSKTIVTSNIVDLEMSDI